MPYNLSETVWRDAERDFRQAFEAYLQVDAGDTRLKTRTFSEYVEWLARHIKFAGEFAHGRSSMDGMTSRDLAMWYLGSNLNRVVMNKVMNADDNAREAVYLRVASLPPVPCIGPVRVDRRNARKEEKRASAARPEPPSPATKEASLRASIEHRLTVEAREMDEALVSRLVAERRRRATSESAEAPLPPPAPQPPLPKKSARRQRKAAPTLVENAKREVDKIQSLQRVEEAQAERRERDARADARLA
jgi:hypothetical protein